jgi:glycosyltransferase involved in cell wall biosynthesis
LKKRYKIALVCDWYLPRIGGLELHLYDLARALNERGHEAHIICVIPGPTEDRGIKVHRLPVPMLPFLKTVRNPQAAGELERVLLRERFDIVHAHNAFSPLSHVAMFLARRLGIPSVFTEHSVLRGYPSAIFRAIDQVVPWTAWPTEFVAVSEFCAEDLRQLTGRNDVCVVRNALRISDWVKPRPRPEPNPKELRVTSVMRLTRRKRPMEVIRLVPQLLARLPKDVRLRVTLVGDGNQRKNVEREIRRLGVSDHVELPGFLPRDEIRRVLEQSDVFILPTSKEALSIASLEARCVGVPVVALNHGGVGEVVEHGSHGLLASDMSELVDFTAKLLLDAPLRHRLSAACQKGLERFSWDHAIRLYDEVYDRAMRRFHGPRSPKPEPLPDGVSVARSEAAVSAAISAADLRLG